MTSAPKPLIGVRDRAVAGSVRESSEFQANPDFTYVQGYSDKRRENDAALSAGHKPPNKLPYRLHYFRAVNSSGGADRDLLEAQSTGYFRVTKENIGSIGIEPPLNAVVTADGGYRVGDVELWACPANRARQNEAAVRRAIESQDAATGSALHSAGEQIDRTGTNVTATSESHVEVTKT